MDYSKLSDDEINDLVSDAMKVPPFFSWCSKWEFTGPIMVKNRIGIKQMYEFDDETDEGIHPLNKWEASYVREDFFSFRAEHTNPLRAALIVFLMMKDSENEQRD